MKTTVDEITSAWLLMLLVFHFVEQECSTNSISDIQVSVPSTHTTLSGDLHIKFQSPTLPPLLVQLSRLDGDIVQPLMNFSILPQAEALTKNTTLLTIPCKYFSRGGKYYVLVKKNNLDEYSEVSNTDEEDEEHSVITRTIDVQWPMPQLNIEPEHIQTYPKTPVIVTLEFPEVLCSPTSDCLATSIPEFWLELHYCGHSPSTCDVFSRRNQSYQILHAEQVRGFPGSQNITLQCEYFGLAGHYALFLRSTSTNSRLSYKAVFIKADWSEEFVFNVHAQSIFPCDRHNGGITVLFQYPACILLTGDRVRVFARHRAEVTSLVPPTSLEYVAEQRVLRGSNKLKFDCDLFSERYIEYCFVYVSQSITGAVADVRMDCVSTLPVRESKSGGWGPWSPWTQCSGTCIGGTRTRYRLCDSPLPRFGGKYCEGQAVETEKCGTLIDNIWECFDGNFNKLDQEVADTSRVKEEVGLYCRCGCVVHLGKANPRRILASSSQSCPGRIFWQIQADSNCIIQFRIEWFDSSCGFQWLKIRDGMSLSSTLLADLSDVLETRASIINSTGSTMLLEFFSDEFATNGQQCGGGFIAYARQFENFKISPLTSHRSNNVSPFLILKLTAVHSTSIFFLSGLLIAMALLGAQYTFRYRKYHIAYTEDEDSTADPSVSFATLMSRRSSNSTLFSDVLSLHHLEQQVVVESHQQKQVSFKQEDQDAGITGVSTSRIVENQPSKKLMNKENFSTISQIEPDADHFTHSSDIKNKKQNDSKETHEEMKNNKIQRYRDEAAPTSAKGHYSSSRRTISTATIRNTIPKETKEKKNRERLLAGPSGSDFSISGIEVDLEIDYYDYNVQNAGAAPGSYLGMDPAFLVYIPPLYGSGELSLDEEDEHQMKIIQQGGETNIEEKENNYFENEKLLHSFEKLGDSDRVRGEDEYRNKNKSYLEEEYRNKNKSDGDGKLSEVLENLPVTYESKLVRMNLQELEVDKDVKNIKSKIEEFPMIDSNILDEIKYADEEDDEKH